MSALDWTILFVVLIAIVAYGSYKTRKNSDLESYLKGNNSVVPFKGRLNNPKKNFSMLLDLTINKIKYTINKFRA
jgi:hypothetical protein